MFAPITGEPANVPADVTTGEISLAGDPAVVTVVVTIGTTTGGAPPVVPDYNPWPRKHLRRRTGQVL